ncbi:hypothetical protein AB1Y20_005437 [Prymnesium parvum]|uniref:non-specific serine/threonine protein kinase n=1 Tax=Prymnesium parvum TaxID=97485 RepID=A0AB34J601_PRYPA
MDAYERLEFLGKGTTGSVHKLRRRTDGCLFVEKQVVLTGFSELQRSEILNEASVMSQLLHPNVVAYEESFVSEDMLHIIMELLPGGDLAQELRRKGSPLEEEKIWSILAQVCEGLQHLHSRRILHRDIKPENIFADGRGMYKIGDLGLGRVLSTQSSHARTGVGTPLYFSPEMCEERPYNEKSDVWALGCLTYELCSLSPPFVAANQMALARKITSSTPAPLAAHFSMELQFLVMKMLEKDVSKRPSASQILEYSPVRARLPEIRALRDNAKLFARQARWGSHLHSKVMRQRLSFDSFRNSHLWLAWRAQYDSPPLTVAAARTRPSEAALSPVLSSALCDKPPSPPAAADGSDTTSPTRPSASPSALPPSTPSAQIQSNAAPTLSPATPPFSPIATGCWDSPSSAETPRVRGGRVPLPDGVTKVRCRCSRSPSSCGMTPRVASMASQRSSPLDDHSSGDGFRSATESGAESDLRYKQNSKGLEVVAGQTTSTFPPVSTPECGQAARMPQLPHSEKRVLSEAQAIGEAHAAWVASGGKASAAELHDVSASNTALRKEICDGQQQVQQLTQALQIEQDERLRERNEAEHAAGVLRERLEQSAREKKELLEQMSVMREQLSASTAKVYHADRIAAMLQLHCSKLDEGSHFCFGFCHSLPC